PRCSQIVKTTGDFAGAVSNAPDAAGGRRCLKPDCAYSYLRASRGSTRDARRAGRYAASCAAISNTTIAAASVAGSAGLTPNSNDSIQRDPAHTAGSPATAPITTSRVPPATTDATTRCDCAPSAMRIPISLVRRETL